MSADTDTDIVTIDDRAIRRLERQFHDLGETGLGTALAGALSDIVLDENRRISEWKGECCFVRCF